MLKPKKLLIITFIALFVLVVTGLFFKYQPSKIKPLPPIQAEPLADPENYLQSLLQAAKVPLREISSTQELQSMPSQLKIYLEPEHSDTTLELLTFIDKSKGYRASFNLDFPYVSARNFYDNIFRDNSVQKLYSAYGKQVALLYGRTTDYEIVIIFTRINVDNTKVQIETYGR